MKVNENAVNFPTDKENFRTSAWFTDVNSTFDTFYLETSQGFLHQNRCNNEVGHSENGQNLYQTHLKVKWMEYDA